MLAWLRLSYHQWRLRMRGYRNLRHHQANEVREDARQTVHEVGTAVIELQTVAEEAENILAEAQDNEEEQP